MDDDELCDNCGADLSEETPVDPVDSPIDIDGSDIPLDEDGWLLCSPGAGPRQDGVTPRKLKQSKDPDP